MFKVKQPSRFVGELPLKTAILLKLLSQLAFNPLDSLFELLDILLQQFLIATLLFYDSPQVGYLCHVLIFVCL